MPTTPETQQVALLEQIRAAGLTFTKAESRVAEAIVSDPHMVLRASVSELAQEARTSPATVVRMCAVIGLRGFQDLKITLATQLFSTQKRLHMEIDSQDDADAVLTKVVHSSEIALQRASSSLDGRTFEDVARRILSARNVLFVGVGTSAPLAQDSAYRLASLGVRATFSPDVHQQHVSARMLEPHDLMLAISHTGSTLETLASARAAKESGATTVSLTSFHSSPLTEIVDFSLVAGAPETSYRVEAMTSRIVHLACLDALYVFLARLSESSERALALTESVLIEHRI
ncbi:MurR/RpiR family transcriptional regulator [Leucobacter salsicius]|uniref:MurR/RpiR family transcriptional regulator n=1 Tax=Leucobacter salsicius TaxID=664638 RepID=UPI0004757B49|nr:MurR/RpiR family transcriptional regulator [Leucobacter salsicius]